MNTISELNKYCKEHNKIILVNNGKLSGLLSFFYGGYNDK